MQIHIHEIALCWVTQLFLIMNHAYNLLILWFWLKSLLADRIFVSTEIFVALREGPTISWKPVKETENGISEAKKNMSSEERSLPSPLGGSSQLDPVPFGRGIKPTWKTYLLAIVINHLLAGMILQAGITNHCLSWKDALLSWA